MILLAQVCGSRVAVEGVETAEHEELLKELDCDLLQGFFLARPMSSDALRASFSTESAMLRSVSEAADADETRDDLHRHLIDAKQRAD